MKEKLIIAKKSIRINGLLSKSTSHKKSISERILDIIKKHGKANPNMISRELDWSGGGSIARELFKLEKEGKVKHHTCECGIGKIYEIIS